LVILKEIKFQVYWADVQSFLNWTFLKSGVIQQIQNEAFFWPEHSKTTKGSVFIDPN
jgi:hypothetical protein